MFDLLGYGASDKPDTDVSLGVQNGLLAAVMAAANLDRPHVLAHDFGGTTALRAHLLDRIDYASLSLVDPVSVHPWGSPFVQHVRDHEAAFAGMPAYMHDAVLGAYLATACHRPLDADAMAILKRPWTGRGGQSGFYRQIAQMDLAYTEPLQMRFGDVRCPVQLLWGVEDQWIPLSTGRELARRLNPERFVEVPGSGHLVQEDRPEAIVAAMADFLKRHETAPGPASDRPARQP